MRISFRERFLDKVSREARSGGCWLWTGCVTSKGYGHIKGERSREMLSAHRAAYELFVGAIPGDLIVRHRCDVPTCVNPDHLELGTAKDNSRDMIERGRSTRRISGEQAKRIRDLYEAGEPQRRIAVVFGIGQAQVSRIVRGIRTGQYKSDAPRGGARRGPAFARVCK